MSINYNMILICMMLNYICFKKVKRYFIMIKPTEYNLRAGVCRSCDMIELMATCCNFSLCRRVEKVCVDRQLLRYS